MRSGQEDTLSQRTTLTYSSTSGLDKAGCLRQIEPPEAGTATVKITGRDVSGNKLTMVNDTCNLKVELRTELPHQSKSLAKYLYDTFGKLKLKIAEPPSEVKGKLATIARKIFKK